MGQRNSRPVSRRQFLRMGLSLAAAGLAAGCRGPLAGLAKPAAVTAGGVSAGRSAGSRTLKILQWTHFVPAYNDWFVKEYAANWGAQHGVQVTVDLVAMDRVVIPASAEAAQGHGHDLICFPSPAAAFEEEVLDLADVVKELEGKVGSMTKIAKAATFNPKTGRYFGVSDHWVPPLLHWRKDLWEQAEPGARPDKWDDVLRVGRKLKQMNAPVGIGFSTDLDSTSALLALLLSFGGSVQDEAGRISINSPQTVEAVKYGISLFREAASPEVLAWSSSSNNAFLAAKAGSLIVNALSALRAVEKNDPQTAGNLLLAPAPAGPARRLTPINLMGTYVIWKFAENPDLAKQFLVDLIGGYSGAFDRSQLYNLPSWPGTVPDFKAKVASDATAQPKDKYALLDGAEQWVTNIGYPGSDNAVVAEAASDYVVPRMFALAASGHLTPQEAVKWAEGQIAPIHARWQSRGLI